MAFSALPPVRSIASTRTFGSHPTSRSRLVIAIPIPEAWAGRIASHPGVERVAPYVYGFTLWHKQDGGLEQCFLIGSRLAEGEVGSVSDMSPELRGQLTQPGSITIYAPDKGRLGMQEGVSDVAEVAGQRVHLAGVMYEGGRQIGMMPGFYCSLRTARRLLPNLGQDETMYLIARCRNPADSPEIARAASGTLSRHGGDDP